MIALLGLSVTITILINLITLLQGYIIVFGKDMLTPSQNVNLTSKFHGFSII